MAGAASQRRPAAALAFAWLLLAELPRPIQLVGGLLVLAGVVTVRSGEPATATTATTAAARGADTTEAADRRPTPEPVP